MGITVSTLASYLQGQVDLEDPTYFIAYLAGTIGLISFLCLVKAYGLQFLLGSLRPDETEDTEDTDEEEEELTDTEAVDFETEAVDFETEAVDFDTSKELTDTEAVDVVTEAVDVVTEAVDVVTEAIHFDTSNPSKRVPVSVNFHFTRVCNYACGFCFHTAKTSHLTPLEDAKRGLKMLADKGMKKLNLSGGEPFMEEKYVGEICKFSKEVLKLQSISIVSNGSKIRKQFFTIYGRYLDILAISVDSFDEETNIKIGRGKGKHLQKLQDIARWCTEFGVKFKLNSVINRYNHEEDFSANIACLDPARWKCFQVLQVDTENAGEQAKRDCTPFLISDEEFDAFCDRHNHLECFVPESNRMMKSSYIILDEYMRFLSKGDEYKETKSILEGNLDELLMQTDWEPDVFVERGGVYDWTKEEGCASGSDPAFEW